MTAVEDLVARGESGVLEVTGNPSGVVYLDDGHIAYARASWVPGLGAQLRAFSPALAALAEPPFGQDADEAAIAALAVRSGYLTPAQLHELIRSTIVDAFLVLTIPLVPHSPVTAIRFTPNRTYWTDMFPRLGIDLVRQEARRRAELMAECGLAPTTTVAPRDLTAPAVVLTREQWAMACQIGERASARDIALQHGASLSDTVQCLGSLVRAGLCTPVGTSGQGQLGASVPDWNGSDGDGPGPIMPDWIAPDQNAQHQNAQHQNAQHQNALSQGGPTRTPDPEMELLPARRTAGGARDRLDWHVPVGAGQPPSMDILRQVLSGLRKLT